MDKRNEDITEQLVEGIKLYDENTKIPFISIHPDKERISFS